MNTRAGRLVAATVAAVATLALAGCGQQPGIVAYVGEEEITQQQLDSAIDGIEQTVESGQQVSDTAVANVLIHGSIARQVAAQQSISITDAQREEILGTSNLAPLLRVPAAKVAAYDAATQELVIQTLGQEAYLAAVAKTTVTLNPRFGVLDPNQKTIVQDSSSSLSVPLATPSPVATPGG